MALFAAWHANAEKEPNERVVVAYVTAGKNDVPDPTVMTHINYAFGTVNETFNGVNIQDPDRLKMIVGLKQQNPKLKVLLSIGGWTAGRFSEMAATKENRSAFAKDCKRIVEEFGLDGIDMDWEYPSSSEAGISSSPDDIDNFTLLQACAGTRQTADHRHHLYSAVYRLQELSALSGSGQCDVLRHE